ncbi:MAG: serine/threonine protein kinase [Candidatus Wallbacteria bacterium]|nr:serine/threonine protein kinase [Candidatus Wallbacteria bacterium]
MFTIWLWLLRVTVIAVLAGVYLTTTGKASVPAGLPMPGLAGQIGSLGTLLALWLVSEVLGAGGSPPDDLEGRLEAAHAGRPYVPQLRVEPPERAEATAPAVKKEPIPDRIQFTDQVLKLSATGQHAALAKELPKPAVLDLLLEASPPPERLKLLVAVARALEAAGDLDGAFQRARQARDLNRNATSAREVLVRVSVARPGSPRLDEIYPLVKELKAEWREELAPVVLKALELGLTRPTISARLVDEVWRLLETFRRFDDVAEPFAEAVEAHVKRHPERADLLTLVARLRGGQGQTKKALAAAGAALALTSECPAVYRFLIEHHTTAGTLSELAGELMRKKAAGTVSSALDAALGQIDGALELQAAAAGRAGRKLAPLDLGMALRAGKDYPSAITALQEALRSATVDSAPFVRFLLATAFLRSGHPDPAVEHVDHLDPEDLLLEQRYELAADLEAAGRLGEARRLYASVAAGDRMFGDVELCLARLDQAAATADPKQRFEESLAAALSVRYKSPRLAGQGGMGLVYRASDANTGAAVAIKVLNPMIAGEAEHRRRFLREANTLAELSHPGVVRILDVSEKPVPYYAMEFLEGSTLAERLHKEGRIDTDDAVRIAARMADALGYCHGKGLIHRDVKPANVFLEARGRIVLIDFGLVHADKSTALTRTGALMGTPAYMAPEQVCGEPISFATDIYALGVTLYEMVTGALPFEGEDLIGQVLSKPPPPPHERQPGILESVERTILRCLQKDPAARFASCSELRDVLG